MRPPHPWIGKREPEFRQGALAVNIHLFRWPLWAAFVAAAAVLLGRLAAWHFGWGDLPAGVGHAAPLFGDAGAGLLAFWAIGHCDGMDGPVVSMARKALDTGNVNLVLPWVSGPDEPEIRRAFEHAVSVRNLGGEAGALADRYFFETLVRVHRAGEGAPYAGIKPAGRDLGPAVPAADNALDSGSVDAVVQLLTEAIREGMHKNFHAAMERKQFHPDDVDAGRAYVAAYVTYVHYVEHLWHAARGGSAENRDPGQKHHL